MSPWLQIVIAYAVSFFWFCCGVIHLKSFAIEDVLWVEYILFCFLPAFCCDEFGFFFSTEFVAKNIFTILAVENLITGLSAKYFETFVVDRNIAGAEFKSKKILTLVVFIALSICWGVFAYLRIR